MKYGERQEEYSTKQGYSRSKIKTKLEGNKKNNLEVNNKRKTFQSLSE